MRFHGPFPYLLFVFAKRHGTQNRIRRGVLGGVNGGEEIIPVRFPHLVGEPPDVAGLPGGHRLQVFRESHHQPPMFAQEQRNPIQAGTKSGVNADILSGKGSEMRAKKDTVEWRWQAYNPDTGAVAKQGPVRNDYDKVERYAREIVDGIEGTVDGWNPAPYWDGLHIRIIRRTITPWATYEEMSTETTDTLV